MKREINSIVITGPTGAIGMAVIRACIEKGIRMLLITRENSRRNSNIPDSDYITVEYADIADYDDIDAAALLQKHGGNYDAFLHLAWMGTTGNDRNDALLQGKNVEYTLSAVRLAHRLGCKIFMGAGSQAEYGRVEGYLNSRTPASPENEYGKAKLLAGNRSRDLCTEFGILHIWLRVLSIYGPFDNENSMVSSAIRGFLNREETAFTRGEQKWDYLFGKDAAEIILRLLASGKSGKVYCVGSGKQRLLKEYILDIYKAVWEKDATEEEVGIGKMPYAPGQVMFLCADTSELEEDIGSLSYTPFEEGIRQTVEWYKNRQENR